MMRRAKVLAICALVIVPIAAITAKAGDGLWLSKVPESERVRPNPMAGDPNSVAAGAKLFRQNCATCHGKQAQGQSKRPNLHSDRLKSATPGELEWLLKNGSLRNGMPSWSRLPEPQRWQLVTFLKSLD
ncbi:MAG TPA: c-type cytochrome [Terriglobales bacterium]|nr:c-type cytochrome [Terriglobales bacterium]